MGQNQSKVVLPPITPQNFTKKYELIFLHCVAITLHIVSGSLGALLSSSTPSLDVAVVAPFFSYVTGTSGVFVMPHPKTVFTVSILWPLVAVEFITAAFHILYIMQLALPKFEKFTRTYVADTSSINPLRWTEYAITATLMSAFGNIALGITDFYVFLKMISSGIALQSVGYIIELLSSNNERARLRVLYNEDQRDNGSDTDLCLELKSIAIQLKKREERVYRLLWWFIGSLLNFMNVAILLTQTFGSDLGDALWLYVANSLPFAFWFNTFGYIAQKTYERWRQFADPYFSEKYYILLSVSTKIAVFWLAFGTFREIVETNGAIPKTSIRWDVVRYCAMILPATWLAVYSIVDARQWTRFVQRYARSNDDEYLEMFGTRRSKPKSIWR